MNSEYFVPPEQCVNPNDFVICIEVQKKDTGYETRKKNRYLVY